VWHAPDNGRAWSRAKAIAMIVCNAAPESTTLITSVWKQRKKDYSSFLISLVRLSSSSIRSITLVID